jgi:hypothetical protein
MRLADQVIAILPVEAQAMINPTPPQFRVLYRANWYFRA